MEVGLAKLEVPTVCQFQILYSASVTITHYLLMLAWQTMAIFKYSSLLVRAEGMKQGERVDVTIHMITNSIAIESFT